MSFLGKKWVIISQRDDELIQTLLKNRGISEPGEKERYLSEGLEGLHDPMKLADMDKAVSRIQKAVADGEKIMIFGDYDIDGVTATAIMYDFLRRIGADAAYTLPNRQDDGYGLKDYFIRKFKEDGVGLLVTVDCGTANFDEIRLANELGFDTIITDHHTIPEKLPPAFAVVNPKRADCKYPISDICGSTIAFKVVTALAPFFMEPGEAAEYLYRQLSIVTLGVIGDCMPLRGENRVLVREGLKSLMAGNNTGVLAMLKEAGLSTEKIDSTTIGYQIGPRLNAAGRLDSPTHAFELLLGNLEKVSKLNELNDMRREIVKTCVDQAIMRVKSKGALPNIIVEYDSDWLAGALGLIAGRLADHFSRPSIAMQAKGDMFIGSMRSVRDFDITSFMRTHMPELFDSFGGHKLAGGFTLPKKNLDEFLARVHEAAGTAIDPADFTDQLNIDCEIMPEELSMQMRQEIDKLEPFGLGNPEPVLLIKNTRILGVRTVGANGEHLQFPVQCGEQKLSAIAFRLGAHHQKIDPQKPYDIVFNMQINEWNGSRRLQLRVVDLRESA